MRAMRLHELNADLVMDETPAPEPGPGEVRLKVLACGVNFADTLRVAGKYQEKSPLPFSPGGEVCGIVDAVGEGVSLAPGTRVAAMAGGGFAEYCLAPEALCTPAPDAMSSEAAAAFQIAYVTSHLALDHKARMRPGERLLVLGAAGGVGLTAVEIGKIMGAEVIACARGAERLEIARGFGADHLIDSETEDIRERCLALGGVDVVYDPVGGDQWKAAMRACRPEARMIPIGFASGDIPQIPANILMVKNIDVLGLYIGTYRSFRPEVLRASLATLMGWHTEGRLRPHISNVLPLAEANEALRLLKSREATGKVVVTPWA
ncbi:MAG: NADPH:quinone oxidoreductase family protein [Pseudomonadota bacterium]|nr:NADPH:quinone oxidoreductase family protein [Pseudomonadota bacterium]